MLLNVAGFFRVLVVTLVRSKGYRFHAGSREFTLAHLEVVGFTWVGVG